MSGNMMKFLEAVSENNELDAVAGGSDVSCVCPLGGGTKDDNDKTCACVLAGYSKNGRERCVCGFAGYGYDT